MTNRQALRMLAAAVISGNRHAALEVLAALEPAPRARRPWSPPPDVVTAGLAREWGAETRTADVVAALGLRAGRAAAMAVGAALGRAGYRRERVMAGGVRGYVYRRAGGA